MTLNARLIVLACVSSIDFSYSFDELCKYIFYLLIYNNRFKQPYLPWLSHNLKKISDCIDLMENSITKLAKTSDQSDKQYITSLCQNIITSTTLIHRFLKTLQENTFECGSDSDFEMQRQMGLFMIRASEHNSKLRALSYCMYVPNMSLLSL